MQELNDLNPDAVPLTACQNCRKDLGLPVFSWLITKPSVTSPSAPDTQLQHIPTLNTTIIIKP